MAGNIFLMYFFGLLSSIIFMYLFTKINIEHTLITRKSKIIFILLLSAFQVISFKCAGSYRVIVNYAVLILANVICFKRSILHSTINSTLAFIVYVVGESAATLTLICFLNIDVVAIQTNSYFQFLIYFPVFVYASILIHFMKFLFDKVKVIKKDKEEVTLLMLNSIFIALLSMVTMKLFEYLYKTIKNHDRFIFVQLVIILIIILFLSLTILILINKYIRNKYKYNDMVEVLKLDRMTNTLNRETGLSMLKDAIEERRTSNDHITICYIDINDLKDVNDTYGHSEGDRLIKQVASVIKENIRETDTITRLGGDEFLLTFMDCKINYAEDIINRINEALKSISKDSVYNISISHGFFEIEPKLNFSIDHIIELADKEMYKFKRKYKEKLAANVNI